MRKTVMPRIMILALICLCCMCVACSFQKTEVSKVTILIPDLQAGKMKATGTKASRLTGDWGGDDPTTISDFNCFGVLVSWPNATGGYGSCSLASSALSLSSVLSVGMVAPGTKLTAEVPKGDGRIFYVVGFRSNLSSSCPDINRISADDRLQLSSPYLLGSQTASLSKESESLTLTVKFKSDQKMDYCSGASFAWSSTMTVPPIPMISSVNMSSIGSLAVGGPNLDQVRNMALQIHGDTSSMIPMTIANQTGVAMTLTINSAFSLVVGRLYDLVITPAYGADVISNFSITLDDGSVSTGKIVDLAVTSEKIAVDAVTTVKIIDGAITAPKLHQMGASANQVLTWTGSAWGPSTMTIADGSVTTTKIADNNITTVKILDGNITARKLAPMGATLTGQILTWNNSNSIWEATTPSGTSLSPDDLPGTGGGVAGTQPTTLGTCPTGYVLVPGDANYGTTDFCVMKYEAKGGSRGVSSQANGYPLQVISSMALGLCQNLGPGYGLINNKEWMTIATNIVLIGANWTSGTVGNGQVFRGHIYNTIAKPIKASPSDSYPCYGLATEDSNSYNTTWCNDESGSPSRLGHRTHTLSNTNKIWDLSGNSEEWVDFFVFSEQSQPNESFDGGSQSISSYNSSSVTDSMTINDLRPLHANYNGYDDTWNETQGLGLYRQCTTSTACDMAIRSGNYWSVSQPFPDTGGIFSLYFPMPAGPPYKAGFRCVYRLPHN